MVNRILLGALLLLCTIGLGACLNQNDMLPTEHNIAPRKAKEDFQEFLQILKKAHPALYAYTPQSELERLGDSLQATITENITQRQLFNMLSLVVEKISCAHTNLYMPDATVEAIGEQRYFFPYPLTLVEDKLLVNIVGNRLPQGTEIKSINGKPVAEILRKLAMYNSTDGMRTNLRRHLAADDFGYQYFLQYGPFKQFEVEYQKTDSSKTEKSGIIAVTLTELNNRNRNERYYYDPTDVDYDFYTVDAGGYAVMKVRTFEYDSYSKDEAFENFCKNTFAMLKLKPGIKTLVIDIRQNAGGNYSNCHLLYSYLAQQPFQEYKQVSARIKKLPESSLVSDEYSGGGPDDVGNLLNDNFYKATNGKYYIADSLNAMVNPLPQRFNGKVLVVVNGEVSSAAAYFASLVKNAGRGKIIGEETRGGAYMHNGFRNVVYELPNSKIQFAFSIANVIHSLAAREDYGRGVQPDYPKPSALEDFKNNKDTQLNFIQDSLLKN
jgi:Peptidase family S41